MTHHVGNYWPQDVEIVDGEDCFLIDKDGRKYLDFVAGWCVGNVGWKRREIQKAAAQELERGVYVTPYFRFQETEKLAATLIENVPGKRLSRVFRCTSGSEAVEFAIKCARAAAGKKTIVSIDGVYHGHTYGAASIGTALTAAMAPGVPGFMKIPMPGDGGVSAEEVINKFEKLVRENQDIAAFFSEPVWSNAGVFIPPPDFLPKIEKICREHGILFIMDEVATGFGRCGKLFGSRLWGLEPDIMCLAKGLTGGYGTMGATLVSEEVYEKVDRKIPVYSTFGWVPTDIAAAQANIEIILREKLWENARATGEYLLGKLKLLENHKSVKQVRGIGLLLGVELANENQAARVQEEALKQGLLVETAGSALFLSPPLTLTRELADQGTEILKKILNSNKI